MGRKELKLETIKDLDIEHAVDKFEVLAQQAAKDCLERPLLTKGRKVILEIEMRPDRVEDGVCDLIRAVVKVRSKYPEYASRDYRLGVTAKGHVFFNDGDPDNPYQRTFEPLDPDEGS